MWSTPNAVREAVHGEDYNDIPSIERTAVAATYDAGECTQGAGRGVRHVMKRGKAGVAQRPERASAINEPRRGALKVMPAKTLAMTKSSRHFPSPSTCHH